MLIVNVAHYALSTYFEIHPWLSAFPTRSHVVLTKLVVGYQTETLASSIRNVPWAYLSKNDTARTLSQVHLAPKVCL